MATMKGMKLMWENEKAFGLNHLIHTKNWSTFEVTQTLCHQVGGSHKICNACFINTLIHTEGFQLKKGVPVTAVNYFFSSDI